MPVYAPPGQRPRRNMEREWDDRLRDGLADHRAAACLRGRAASQQCSRRRARERGEGDHLWPEFLPGGDAVLFTIAPANGAIENAQIAVLELPTGSVKVLVSGSHAQYVPSRRGSTRTSKRPSRLRCGWNLRAVAFDLGRREVAGTPMTVIDGVAATAAGAAEFAVAANGSLIYVQGGAGGGGQRSIVSVDRQWPCIAARLTSFTDLYRDIRLSPDGKNSLWPLRRMSGSMILRALPAAE